MVKSSLYTKSKLDIGDAYNARAIWFFSTYTSHLRWVQMTRVHSSTGFGFRLGLGLVPYNTFNPHFCRQSTFEWRRCSVGRKYISAEPSTGQPKLWPVQHATNCGWQQCPSVAVIHMLTFYIKKCNKQHSVWEEINKTLKREFKSIWNR